MNERTDRMVDMLAEEWDNFVLLASRVEDGQTVMFKRTMGNALAIQQQMEDALDDFMFGGDDGDEEESEV